MQLLLSLGSRWLSCGLCERLQSAAGSAITSEMRILEAAKPDSGWKVVLPRQTDVEYEVAHRGDHIFVLLRDPERPNSELLVAPISDPTKTTVSRLMLQ